MTNENRGDKKTVKIANPYLMFLGDAPDQLAAKTANGVAGAPRIWAEIDESVHTLAVVGPRPTTWLA